METSNKQTNETTAQTGVVDYAAADNAFMYSVIESCKHNDIDPGKYISFLLGKLKTAGEGEDLTGLLPCYCGL